jgi:hypothetical protein
MMSAATVTKDAYSRTIQINGLGRVFVVRP